MDDLCGAKAVHPAPTENPMTPLRNKMEADLRLRNLATGTRGQYIRCVAAFARYFGRSPDQLGTAEIRQFLLHLQQLGRAPATRVVYHAALRFLYTETLGRPEVMATVPRPRVRPPQPRLPLSHDEAVKLLSAAAPCPFTYTFIATLLETGLRVTEACHLQVGDIDRTAGMVHVRLGKGAKNRAVNLTDRLYRLLRRYWEVQRPKQPWLFPAQQSAVPDGADPMQRWADHPVSPDTVRERLHRVVAQAGLQRRVTPHDLRRTYATWLLEAGVNLRTVQVLLGHASPETTTRYTQVRPALIRRTPSVLEML